MRSEKGKFAVAALAMIFIIGVATVAFGYDDAAIDTAERQYAEGLTAFRQKNWHGAAIAFESSFKTVPMPIVAYYASVSHVNSDKSEPAGRYAKKALFGEPPLEKSIRAQCRLTEPYVSHARAIIKWAEDCASYETSKATGEAINVTGRLAASIPRPAPPSGISTPGQTSLGLKTSWAWVIRNVTGKWRCDDGGTYFVRQVGEDLWWYGQSQDGGKSWANVFHGKIIGGEVKGSWADLPKGRNTNSGKITLRISSSNSFSAIKKEGGFGGNNWSR